jgi:hypothetical protein
MSPKKLALLLLILCTSVIVGQNNAGASLVLNSKALKNRALTLDGHLRNFLIVDLI